MYKYLKKVVRYDLLSNTFLALSLVMIVLSFFYRNKNIYQYEIIFISVLFYLTSSVIHHYFDKSLTFEILLEYILIGALAFLIIFGIAL